MAHTHGVRLLSRQQGAPLLFVQRYRCGADCARLSAPSCRSARSAWPGTCHPPQTSAAILTAGKRLPGQVSARARHGNVLAITPGFLAQPHLPRQGWEARGARAEPELAKAPAGLAAEAGEHARTEMGPARAYQ